MHVPLIKPIDLLILFSFSLVTSTTLTVDDPWFWTTTCWFFFSANSIFWVYNFSAQSENFSVPCLNPNTLQVFLVSSTIEASIVEETKNTCKVLGFKQGTEKFSDCALKLYTQKIELAEKKNQQVVVQNQGSSTVRVVDVTRENENNMRRSMGLINGTCTLATYYSC